MLIKQNKYQPKQQKSPTYNLKNKLIQQVNEINGQKLIRHPQYQNQDINKMNKLKFIGANTNKYYEVPNSNSNKKMNKNDQSRVSVIKFYQLFPKQPSRITFGPDNFKNNGQKQLQYKINNPQYIIPITHKHKKLSKVSKSSSNVQNLKMKPKLYNIVHRQLGLSQQKISRMREDALNYELQRYLKKKGLQYLQQNKQKQRRVHTQFKQKSEITSQQQQINQKPKKIKTQKYPNYIPEVFPKIQKNKKNSKDIKSVQKDNIKMQKTKNRKKAQSKQQLKIDQLNEKQQILGKQVYDKVQDYFQLHKQKVNYFVRVKSQQKIDQALIQYLKTKIDRADLILNTKKDKKHSLLLFKNN